MKATEKQKEYMRRYLHSERGRMTNAANVSRYRKTKNGWIRYIITSKRSSCKRLGIEFNLTSDWLTEILNNGQCEVTGILFSQEFWLTGKGLSDPWMPTIDRVDPAKGYTQDNCQVVVWIYNKAKNSWPHETVVKLAEALIAKR